MTRATVIQTMEVLLDADLAAADTARCVELLSGVRRARGWLDEFEACVSTQMRCLATTPATPGGGAGVSDAHGSAGRTSVAQGRRKDRRSKILDEAPSFGDALAAGTISAEHVDALANATAGVDDAVKSVLLDQHDALVAAAASKTPEQFARALPRPDPPDRARPRDQPQPPAAHPDLPVTLPRSGDRDDERPPRVPSRARQPGLRRDR